MNHKKFLLTVAAGMILAATGFTILRAAAGASKGYVIAEITVTDPEAYKQYAASVQSIAAKLGGKYLVRGGQTVAVEGAFADPYGSLPTGSTAHTAPVYVLLTALVMKVFGFGWTGSMVLWSLNVGFLALQLALLRCNKYIAPAPFAATATGRFPIGRPGVKLSPCRRFSPLPITIMWTGTVIFMVAVKRLIP